MIRALFLFIAAGMVVVTTTPAHASCQSLESKLDACNGKVSDCRRACGGGETRCVRKCDRKEKRCEKLEKRFDRCEAKLARKASRKCYRKRVKALKGSPRLRPRLRLGLKLKTGLYGSKSRPRITGRGSFSGSGPSLSRPRGFLGCRVLPKETRASVKVTRSCKKVKRQLYLQHLIGRCYHDELNDPLGWRSTGSLTAEWRVGPDGRVQHSIVRFNGPFTSRMRRCVGSRFRQKSRRWRLPATGQMCRVKATLKLSRQ